MPKKKIERPTQQRVWIELDKPLDKQHADEICALANNMLTRLVGGPTSLKFWRSEREGRYCLTTSAAGTYTVLNDNGFWFDLDFFGRPVVEGA